MSYYNFKDAQTDVKSLIHLINLHGDDLVGLELGVFRAESFCTILQNCPGVKELHGIDSWLPYVDYLKEPYDGTPAYEIDLKTIKHIKLTALHNIEFSGHKEKAIIHEKNSDDAVNNFADETFDFIFLDTYMTLEQAEKDLHHWYPKLKKGGLFTGHDWNSSAVQHAVNNYREKYKITAKISTFDNSWAWIK
jgi:hypothetical protein